MRLRDSPTGYGWVSIGLHWAAAGLVVALWFVGESINAQGDPSPLQNIRLHTTLGLCAYVLLTARVAWRFTEGHPGRSPRLGRFSFRSGLLVHYILVAGIAVMLLTGPLMAWSGGLPLAIFGFEIPSPFGRSPGLFEILHWIHRQTATVLMSVTALHILGVTKHVVFDRDGTLDKMMVPEPAASQPSSAREDSRRL